MMVTDGFDAETMRVLAAWQHQRQHWTSPSRPCPDDGRPTADAWSWLVSGWDIDVTGVAAAAGVSRMIAREKLDVLIGNHLIYPDGGMARAALSALKTHVAQRIGAGKKKKPPAPAAPSDASGGEAAN